MRYYNEAKAERTIRRRAGWITFFVFAFAFSGVIMLASDEVRAMIVEPVLEWIQSPDEPIEAATKDRA